MKVFQTIVFFEFDKFTLSSSQTTNLEAFINAATENSNLKILIEAHTDTMGTKSYNAKLSQKRAEYIKKYLMNKNLPNTIETIAYGESNLLVDTYDEIKEKQNRRAELYLK